MLEGTWGYTVMRNEIQLGEQREKCNVQIGMDLGNCFSKISKEKG
jgi:hypothetical protein